jgi:hypothetical protein
MFPYAMLATTPLFYSTDWPKRLTNHLTKNKYAEKLRVKQLSAHCIYIKASLKSESKTVFGSLLDRACNIANYGSVT